MHRTARRRVEQRFQLPAVQADIGAVPPDLGVRSRGTPAASVCGRSIPQGDGDGVRNWDRTGGHIGGDHRLAIGIGAGSVIHPRSTGGGRAGIQQGIGFEGWVIAPAQAD